MSRCNNILGTSGSDPSPLTLLPSPGAVPTAFKTLPEEFAMLFFSTVRGEGSSEHSLLVLSTETEHWPSCVQGPLSSFRMPCSRQIAYVPCALCSWNRIWTRYSSIWKKWGSLTCLASAKQQEHGNASCATTLKKQPVRDTPLTAPNHVYPWGLTGTSEPHCSSWPSSCLNILSCNNTQRCAWWPLLSSENGISSKWEWGKELLKGRDT